MSADFRVTVPRERGAWRAARMLAYWCPSRGSCFALEVKLGIWGWKEGVTFEEESIPVPDIASAREVLDLRPVFWKVC